jgi:hypothetical protein
MGQGGKVCQHQTGVIRTALAEHSRCPFREIAEARLRGGEQCIAPQLLLASRPAHCGEAARFRVRAVI